MLEKTRILLTLPVQLSDQVDKAATAMFISRGEFIRRAIFAMLSDSSAKSSDP